ncbi:MAG: MBL fold metallo-hydrolase [Dehalococcoidia bacterium]
MKLQFLGSGNAFAPGGRGWSCFLLNDRYLFDCGPQALSSLKRLAIDPARVEAIFITHFHADHWLGAPFLFLEYDYMTRRDKVLEVVGPPGIEEKFEDMYERGYFKNRKQKRFKVSYTEAARSKAGEVAGLPYVSLPMNHAREKLEAFGYRVTIEGQLLAYTGDTAWCDELLQLGEGADAMVIDCSYPGDGDAGTHMGFNDAKRLRSLIDPKTTLILTHLQETPAESLPSTIVAEDFATYEI